MDLDGVQKEEQDLARRLRDVCTPLMDEKKSKLRESTELLYRMGHLYIKKAALGKGMDQKLDFIKGATLLHGARVRSKKFLKNHMKIRIHHVLNEMETLLMEKSSGGLSVPLLEVSKRVLMAFESYRAAEKTTLDSLERIEENLSDSKVKEICEEKAEIMRNLLTRNSENFKTQMQNITINCLEILGSPPCGCDFAIVGLGSLARDEVTLYSDFEHVILLEDMAQYGQDYSEILEYFRWFSVIFHVIVIGIGETIIPSVGVESLNDLYTEDRTKNWFYDSFTPSGVSLDGMMPHACKIPLGRQKKTKNKDFTMELIKPVSQMANYLTREEDMVNEYCLKDVLCETCFVYGSEHLYLQFKNKVKQILALEDNRNTPSSLSDAASKNRNRHVRGFAMFQGETVDPKVQFYRPLSVFIGYAARVQSITGKSGFDKVPQLRDISLSQDTKSLEWAFAVACEIRSKVYEVSFGNRANTGTNVLEHVGVPCLINCASAIADLCLHFKSLSHVDEFQKFLGAKLSVFMFLEKYGEAKKEISKLINQANFMESFTHLFVLWKQTLARIYIIEAKVFPKSKLAPLQMAENLLLEIENCREHYKVCLLLSSVYYHQGRFAEARNLAITGLEKLKKEEFECHEMLEAQSFLIRAAKCCMNLTEFVDYCIDFLSKNHDIISKLKFGFAIAEGKCDLGQKDEARLIFKRLMELWMTEALKVLPLRMCRMGITDITTKQGSEGWLDDCLTSYDMLEDILRPGRDTMDRDLLMCHRVEAYVKASAWKTDIHERTNLCEKAIEICKSYPYQGSFHTLYCFAVSAIFEYKVSGKIEDFEVIMLHKIFGEAPSVVRKDVDVKATFGRCFIKFLPLLHQNKKLGPMEICGKVDYCWRIMGTPHPYLYPYLRDLLLKVYLQLHEIFGRPLDLEGILTYYKTYDFSKELNSLWKSVFQKNQQLRRNTLKFMRRIYSIISVSAYLHLHDKVNSLPQNLSSDPDFKNAVYSYFKYYLDQAINLFWRIVHQQKRNSHLQRLSILFLCNYVIYYLIEKCKFDFYHDYFKQQLSAGPVEAVKAFNVNQSVNMHKTPMSIRLSEVAESIKDDIAVHERERFSHGVGTIM